MLGLAGMELIFFTMAGMGLCWICAEHRIDNIEMFLLFLSRAYTQPRPFLNFALPGWGGWGSLGGDTARTGDPN